MQQSPIDRNRHTVEFWFSKERRLNAAKASIRIILAGIELVHMMRKQQGDLAASMALSIKQQFEALTA